jgi:methionyl-tRNA formyltransferase
MRLTTGMDEGPVYKQKAVHLSGSESKAELAYTLHKLGAEILGEILPAIADGSLKPRQQPHPDRSTYSRKIIKSDGIINWSKPAEQVEREIRAFADWPGSRTELFGKEVIVTAAHAVPSDGKPGEIEVITDTGLIIVYCQKGSVCIERLKPAGKKEMASKAFIAGYANKNLK